MRLLLTLTTLILAGKILAQQELFQYFEGADTNSLEAVLIVKDSNSCWQIGKPQKTVFTSAFSPDNVIVTDTVNSYPLNDTCSFIADVHNNWGNGGILAFQWMQKLDLDSAADWGMIEFSIDNGVTWENAFDNPVVYNFYGYDPSNVHYMPNGGAAFTGTDTTWKNVWLCFDLSWMPPGLIQFRYTLISDSVETNQDGWMIDNMWAAFTWVHTLNELEPDQYMRVSPNPTKGKVDIVTAKVEGYHIIEEMVLTDEHGREIRKWQHIPTKYFIDLSGQIPGVYFLRVKTNIKEETFRIILEK